MNLRLVFALLSSLAVACSTGASSIPSDPSSSLRCCNSGVVHRCANVAAQDRCNAGLDTIDCTKTAEICGTTRPDGGDGRQPEEAPEAGPPDVDPADTISAKKSFGAVCGDKSECEDELCLTIGNGTAGTCSRACTGPSDCPARHGCELVSGLGIRACLAKGEKRIGDPCRSQFECESSICIGNEKDAYCSIGCALPSECPVGWSCAVIGSGVRYCVR
jgi:hypothetical protein